MKVILRSKIKDITNNWDAYQVVVENAYKRVMSYTTENFVKLIQTGEEWKR